MDQQHLPVAIIGAGPVGLAAAAHLAERDLPFVVFEAGPRVGHSALAWGHVQMFSPVSASSQGASGVCGRWCNPSRGASTTAG